MRRFIVRRLVQALPTLLGITALTFGLLRAAPGDPISQVLVTNEGASPADLVGLRRAYGLDEPVPFQYLQWLARVLTGDLGNSTVNHRPVGELLAAALPNTLLLSVAATLVSVSLGTLLGIVAARRRGTWIDHAARLVAVCGHAVPGFWLALAFILIFSVRLRLLPSGGALTLGASPWDLGDRLRHMVGPVVALSLGGIAFYSRLVRTELLETLGQDFVRTARGKGLREREILWSHALRASLLPMTTALGGLLAALISGALVIEQIFAWPGMGRLAYDAARAKDAPVVLAAVLLVSALLLVGFIVRDIVYVIADPRIHHA